MMLLEVAVTAPVRQTYTYSVDEKNLLANESDYIGRRVLVPFGSRPLMGYVLGKSRIEEGEFQIKPLMEIMDEIPYFQGEQIPFFRWVADYYHYPLGLVIKTALPGGLSATTRKAISLTTKGSSMSVENIPDQIAAKSWVADLFSNGSLSGHQSSQVFASKEECADLDMLIKSGIATQKSIVEKDRVRAKTEHCFGLNVELKYSCGDNAKREEVGPQISSSSGDRVFSRAEKKILKILWDMQQDRSGEMVPRKELRDRYPYGERLLNSLASEGMVIKSNRRVYRSPFGELLPHYPKPDELSAEQEKVISVVCRSVALQSYEPFLLHGVTGSGKTEVYLQAAEETVKRNRTVLVLVPEIALATQIEAHFISRFKGNVALLHSGLSAGEKFDEWWRILSGEAAIVIGARSAVFAPLENIGLIVVDEEHDSSYKQDDGLRYNGRDLAVVRAKSTGCTVILGSATPSIVSHHHGRTSKYQLLSMTRRIGEKKLPEPCLVDLKTSAGKKGRGLFHPELQKGLQETFNNSNQSILLLNRRGFATSVICRDCGTVVECSHCKVNLNRHRQKNILLCHYCGYSLTGSVTCKTCGSGNLHPIGFGTERVEEEARNLLPEATIARLDSDVAADRRKFLTILKAMREKEIDILVGTQIIAKGLHFPEVSLVGIVMADSGLGFPDYRAAEKTYQLITQVTGRAGRGETRGKVIIQTMQPEHYAISLAANNDYETLIEKELAIRQEVGFPPFCRLVFIIVEDREDQAARTSSRTIVEMARTWCRTHDHSNSLSLLGPAPAPLERLRDRYRWQILIKATSLQPLHSLVDWISETYQAPSATRVIIDIDPENML